MSGKNIVMIIVVIGALAVAGVVLYNQLAGDKKMGQGGLDQQLVHLTCRSCKQDTTMTMAEYLDARGETGEGLVACPSCGSPTPRGQPCYECGKVIITTGHNEMPEACPHCKARLDGGA